MRNANNEKTRVLEPNRSQIQLAYLDLDRAIADDAPVRAVWAFVEQFDLSAFHREIKAVAGGAGRPAIDPRILFALWIEATLDGVGSAREIERRCEYDLRYQWICGGVRPGYHVLSDFRSQSEKEFDEVLTQSVAVLLHQGLVTIERVAFDGMRVRAHAGASSFRRGTRLRELRGVVEEQIAVLKAELDADPSVGTRRQQAARRRAVEQRARRIDKALKELPEAEARKKSKNGKKKSEPRTSTTDPEARVMKMANGGFHPAYNVLFVSDTKTKVIAAVDVSNRGSDHGLDVPMAKQLRERTKTTPREWLEDGGCVTLDGINQLAAQGTKVIAPIRVPRSPAQQPTDIRSTDTPAVADWRRRMADALTQQIYKMRGSTAELVNAHARRCGITQLLVTGTTKVRSVLLLFAITHNMRRGWALGRA